MSTDALIAEARERAHAYTGGPEADRLFRLADALEAVSAELRQERERADKNADAALGQNDLNRELGADLSRAEEAIAEAREILNRGDSADPSREAYRILTEYDKKEQTNDQS